MLKVLYVIIIKWKSDFWMKLLVLILSTFAFTSADWVCDDANCADMHIEDHLAYDVPFSPLVHSEMRDLKAEKGAESDKGKELITHASTTPSDTMEPSYNAGFTSWWAHLTGGKVKAHVPQDKTSHIMMIDAGSGGSRLHIYEYDRRIFSTLPPPLSDVGTDSKWTKR